MKKRLLITGGTGLLGLNWALCVRNEYSVIIGIHHRHVKLSNTENFHLQLDSVSEIINSLNIIQPDLVIHAAGLTNVEQCESKPNEAQYSNVILATNLAKSCARLRIPLVHISTDHLFSGKKLFVKEDDSIEPQNVYAKTKAEAEKEVLKHYPETLVVRTNFYGWGLFYRSSFSDFIIDNLRRSKSITLFQDVFYTPIIIEALAKAIHELIDKKVNGIFHIVGDERISKYHFGIKVAEHFQLDSNLIKVGNISENLNLVKRPSDMSLSNKKICNTLGRNLGNIDEHLQRLKHQEKIGFPEELKNCHSSQ